MIRNKLEGLFSISDEFKIMGVTDKGMQVEVGVKAHQCFSLNEQTMELKNKDFEAINNFINKIVKNSLNQEGYK